MAFINLQNISLSFGSTALFEDIRLTVEPSEKVALVAATVPVSRLYSN